MFPSHRRLSSFPDLPGELPPKLVPGFGEQLRIALRGDMWLLLTGPELLDVTGRVRRILSFSSPGILVLLYEELTVIVVVLSGFQWSTFKSTICYLCVLVVH